MAAPITLAVSVNAPPDRITDALSTAEGLASFWTADSRAEPHTGSVARFGFAGPELQMRVDQLTTGRRVAWTCLSDFPMPPRHWEGTTVTWDLTPSDNGDVNVLLQHGNWPASIAQAELASTAYTWARVLTALKGYAETGTPQPVFSAAPHLEES
jgi:uncharacterized protein YndB with AHSA1/START domain